MKTLDIRETEELYHSIKRSAFRLEALPHYDVTDNGRFAAFEQGQPKPSSEIKNDWLKMIESDLNAGKSWSRVHLIEGELTPYVRFELEWGYADNSEVGEEVYILQTSGPSEWSSWLGRDFWLLDDETVIWMEYDEAGRIVARRLSDDQKDVQECVAIRNSLIKAASPYGEFMKTYQYEPRLI